MTETTAREAVPCECHCHQDFCTEPGCNQPTGPLAHVQITEEQKGRIWRRLVAHRSELASAHMRWQA